MPHCLEPDGCWQSQKPHKHPAPWKNIPLVVGVAHGVTSVPHDAGGADAGAQTVITGVAGAASLNNGIKVADGIRSDSSQQL
jgi:hypothetical protein